MKTQTIKKINLLILILIVCLGYSQPNSLKFELIRSFNPWGEDESQNLEEVYYAPQFFNGKSDQFFIHQDEFTHAVIDLEEHNPLQSDPIRDWIYNYQLAYWGQLTVSKIRSNSVLWSSFYGGSTFAVLADREDNLKRVIAFWEISKDTEPVLKNELYPFEIKSRELRLSSVKGFNKDGHLMFIHEGDIVFVSPSGQYVSSLLNSHFSLYYNTDDAIGLGMSNPEIFILNDNKYLLKEQSRLVLLEHGKTGTNQLLLDKDYSSTPIYAYPINSSSTNYRFTFISIDGVYSINLETGESFLEISNDEIGFIPDEIIRLFDGFMVIKDNDFAASDYAFLSAEWVQSEEKTLLQLKAKGLFLPTYKIDDIKGAHILSRRKLAPDYVDTSYEIYRWSIDNNSLDLDESQKDNSIDIYPNPTSGKIKISAASPIVGITVWDILGKQVYKTKSRTADITHLKTGVYFLMVYTNGNRVVKKIIKK